MQLSIICGECGAKVPLELVGKVIPDGADAECPKCGCYHFICIDREETEARNVPAHLKGKLETKS